VGSLIVVLLTILRIFKITIFLNLENYLGVVMFIVAIMLHIQTKKLKLSSIASILNYILQGISILGAIGWFMEIQSRTVLDVVIVSLSNLFVIVLQIVIVVFTFRTARKLKKEFPALLSDYLKLKNQRAKK
jgi:hypothetical protein